MIDSSSSSFLPLCKNLNWIPRTYPPTCSFSLLALVSVSFLCMFSILGLSSHLLFGVVVGLEISLFLSLLLSLPVSFCVYCYKYSIVLKAALPTNPFLLASNYPPVFALVSTHVCVVPHVSRNDRRHVSRLSPRIMHVLWFFWVSLDRLFDFSQFFFLPIQSQIHVLGIICLVLSDRKSVV